MIHHCNRQEFIILVLFTVPFYHFLFSRYLDLTKRHFSSDVLVPFPDLSDSYSRVRNLHLPEPGELTFQLQPILLSLDQISVFVLFVYQRLIKNEYQQFLGNQELSTNNGFKFNGFCPLSKKKTQPPIINNGQYQYGQYTKQNQMKNTDPFKIIFQVLRRYFLKTFVRQSHQIFYLLLFL